MRRQPCCQVIHDVCKQRVVKKANEILKAGVCSYQLCFLAKIYTTEYCMTKTHISHSFSLQLTFFVSPLGFLTCAAILLAFINTWFLFSYITELSLRITEEKSDIEMLLGNVIQINMLQAQLYRGPVTTGLRKLYLIDKTS